MLHASMLLTLLAPGAGAGLWHAVAQSHPLVKGVMALLVLMFAICIYIIFYKGLYLRESARQTAHFLDAFWKTRAIDELYKQAAVLHQSPVAQMFVAGYAELGKLAEDGEQRVDAAGKLDNVERALRRAQTGAVTKLESMVPFLATTGSAAPFIGLFGTVVGILLAFQQMSATGKSTLAEVGGYVSEALMATAIALLAAVPAVMAYNFFVRKIRIQRAEMESFESDFLNIVKRHFIH